MLRKTKQGLLLLVITCLAGCAMLPAKSPLPPDFAKPELQQTVTDLENDPAFSSAAWTKRAWWSIFNDKALDALVEMALHGNPALATAQIRIEQSQLAVRLVELDSGIRYNSDAVAVRQHLSENGLFPPPMGGSTLNEGDISLGAAYALDWWKKNSALLQSSIGVSKAAEAEHRMAELALVGEVVDTYLNWQDVVTRLKLAHQAVDNRRRSLQLADSRLKRGIDTAILSSQMEQLLVQEQDNVKDLETQSKLLRYRLAALTGNGPDWGNKLENPLNSPDFSFPLPQKLPLDWLALRPDLIALKWHAEAAAHKIDGAKADFYPNVDLRLLLGLQSIDLGTWLSTKSWYGSFGPAIHIPYFNTGTLQAKLSLSETEYAAAVAQYNQALIMAAGQVADALTRVSSLHTREQLQHSATVKAEHSLHLQSERYESGLSDRLPVLDKEIAVIAQHVRESKLLADHKRAMAMLFVAFGGNIESGKE